VSQEVTKPQHRDDRQAEHLLHFLYRRAFALAALLAIERDQHARRCRAVASDELDRLTDRGAGGDDVVDDQDPARERSADQGAALTVVLGLLAIEGEGQVA
jgi:hypothetical protein